MLSRGFKDQIYEIFRTLPKNVQVSGKRPLVSILVGSGSGSRIPFLYFSYFFLNYLTLLFNAHCKFESCFHKKRV